MSKYKLSYKSFGEKAILIEWPREIHKEILYDIISFKSKIEENINLLDVIVGYNSLVLVSRYKIEEADKKMYALNELYKQPSKTEDIKTNHWKIPVCYDKKFGIDLEYISSELKISSHEIIKFHSKAIYTVFFIGFIPGFLYLGGLYNQIAIPRKPTPRLRVPKGAVAIGGYQTGIYPNTSSGGWNIIGNSPISFFDITNESPCFAKSGDTISFEPISLKEYYSLKDSNLQIQ